MAGDSSDGESASEADEHEDAEAKAERLGRRLQRQQAQAGQGKAPAAGASSAGAAAKQRQQKGRKRKVGQSSLIRHSGCLCGANSLKPWNTLLSVWPLGVAYCDACCMVRRARLYVERHQQTASTLHGTYPTLWGALCGDDLAA